MEALAGVLGPLMLSMYGFYDDLLRIFQLRIYGEALRKNITDN